MAFDPYSSYSGPAGLPSGCNPLTMPSVTFADCPQDYVDHESEIEDVWIVPVQYNSGTNQYQATALPTNWLYRTDLDSITGGIRATVIGDKPLPELREVALAKGQTKLKNRRHTLNLDITDMHTDNYELIRTLQYPGALIAIWYADRDEYVYGGVNGVVCHIQNAGTILNRGEGALLTGQLVLYWDNLYDPPVGELIQGASPFMAPDPMKAPAAVRSDLPLQATFGKTKVPGDAPEPVKKEKNKASTKTDK